MIKTAKRILFVCLALSIPCFCLAQDSPDFLAQAQKEISLAQQAEKQSYSMALSHFIIALDFAEKIIKDPKNSDLAKKLQSGEAKIGPYNYNQLKDEIIPKEKQKAGAENDIIQCSIYLAHPDGLLYFSQFYAYHFSEVGRYEDEKKVYLIALEDLKTMDRDFDRRPEDYPPFLVWHFLVLDMPDKALEAANLCTDKTKREQSLKDIEKYKNGKYVKPKKKYEMIYPGQYCHDFDESIGKEIKTGNLNNALKMTKVLEDNYSRSSALSTIGEAYLKRKDFGKAAQIFIESIRSIPQDSVCVSRIIYNYRMNGGRDGQVYIEAAREIGTDESKSVSDREQWPLTFIVEDYAYMKGNDRKVLLEMLNATKKIYPKGAEDRKSYALSEIGIAYAKAGLKVGPEERKILHDIVAQVDANKKN